MLKRPYFRGFLIISGVKRRLLTVNKNVSIANVVSEKAMEAQGTANDSNIILERAERYKKANEDGTYYRDFHHKLIAMRHKELSVEEKDALNRFVSDILVLIGKDKLSLQALLFVISNIENLNKTNKTIPENDFQAILRGLERKFLIKYKQSLNYKRAKIQIKDIPLKDLHEDAKLFNEILPYVNGNGNSYYSKSEICTNEILRFFKKGILEFDYEKLMKTCEDENEIRTVIHINFECLTLLSMNIYKNKMKNLEDFVKNDLASSLMQHVYVNQMKSDAKNLTSLLIGISLFSSSNQLWNHVATIFDKDPNAFTRNHLSILRIYVNKEGNKKIFSLASKIISDPSFDIISIHDCATYLQSFTKNKFCKGRNENEGAEIEGNAVLQKCFIYLNRFGVDTKNSKAPMTISYILWSLAHAPHDFKVFNTVIYNDVTKYIQVHGLKNFKVSEISSICGSYSSLSYFEGQRFYSNPAEVFDLVTEHLRSQNLRTYDSQATSIIIKSYSSASIELPNEILNGFLENIVLKIETVKPIEIAKILHSITISNSIDICLPFLEILIASLTEKLKVAKSDKALADLFPSDHRRQILPFLIEINSRKEGRILIKKYNLINLVRGTLSEEAKPSELHLEVVSFFKKLKIPHKVDAIDLKTGYYSIDILVDGNDLKKGKDKNDKNLIAIEVLGPAHYKQTLFEGKPIWERTFKCQTKLRQLRMLNNYSKIICIDYFVWQSYKDKEEYIKSLLEI